MVRDSHTMDYYATIKKNEEVINVLLWGKKNLQNIIKREKKSQRIIYTTFCVRGNGTTYHVMPFLFKKCN